MEITDGHTHYPREPHVGQLWCMGLVGNQSWCEDFGQELHFLTMLAIGLQFLVFSSPYPKHFADQVIRALFVTIIFTSARAVPNDVFV